jgi:hypothetical protein
MDLDIMVGGRGFPMLKKGVWLGPTCAEEGRGCFGHMLCAKMTRIGEAAGLARACACEGEKLVQCGTMRKVASAVTC